MAMMRKRKSRKEPKLTAPERAFANLWKVYGMMHDMVMPELELQYRFHDTRRWHFDFAHVESKTAIEIDGGTWVKGGHTSGMGYKQDREKDFYAAIDGWLVLRFLPETIENEMEFVIGGILGIINRRMNNDQ